MPAPDYNPLQDPWYGESGNGPSASPPPGSGNVDLSGIESRLTSVEGDLERRAAVYVGSVPAGASGAYVLFDAQNGSIDVSVEDGLGGID